MKCQMCYQHTTDLHSITSKKHKLCFLHKRKKKHKLCFLHNMFIHQPLKEYVYQSIVRRNIKHITYMLYKYPSILERNIRYVSMQYVKPLLLERNIKIWLYILNLYPSF